MFTNSYTRRRKLCTVRERIARGIWLAAALGAAVVAHAAAADEINLKGSVRLTPGAAEVTLGDIADIAGPEAERFADLVVATVNDRSRALEIGVADIRETLSTAGVHWGKVSLNGRVVIVRPRGATVSAPPLAMTAVSLKTTAPTARRAAATTATSAADLVNQPTLRGEIARSMVAGLRIDPADLRLTFDPRDESLLDTSLGVHQFEIQPLSNLDSDHVELAVRTWADSRIVNRQSVTVRPMLRMPVAVLRHDLNRGDVLKEQDMLTESRWMQPIAASTLSSLVEAVGRVSNATLKSGDVLKKKHVKRDVLVKRGDRVIVRCLVGGVVITLEAEAKGDGTEGDDVELRKLGERDTFFGTVTGPKTAIVDLSR